jgi:undecaprenyl-diphosphatase
MALWVAALLGLVQGTFMFVPVSSTSHLALVQHWLEGRGHLAASPESAEMVLLDLVLHTGTVVSIVFVFRKQLAALASEVVAERRTRGRRPSGEAPATRLVAMLAVSTVVTGVLGFGVRAAAPEVFSEPRVIAALLVVTGFVLWWTDSARPEGVVRIGVSVAFGVGAIQALALLPGLSRSGLTIAVALALSMRRDAAAQYSFYLAIPTILAATVVQAAEVARSGDAVTLSVASVAVGFVVAAVTGAVALTLVLRLLYAARFRVFSIYVWIVAVAVLVIGDAATPS